MAGTNSQLYALSQGPTFQGKVCASIMKKVLAIIEDVHTNGNLNYTVVQFNRAKSISQTNGVIGTSVTTYYLPLACSTNVIASNFSVVNGETLSDISDAALDSQVYTTVFVDLV